MERPLAIQLAVTWKIPMTTSVWLGPQGDVNVKTPLLRWVSQPFIGSWITQTLRRTFHQKSQTFVETAGPKIEAIRNLTKSYESTLAPRICCWIHVQSWVNSWHLLCITKKNSKPRSHRKTGVLRPALVSTHLHTQNWHFPLTRHSETFLFSYMKFLCLLKFLLEKCSRKSKSSIFKEKNSGGHV